jgi:hypothetical protein
MGSRSLRMILVCAFLAILGFFLLTEHRAHFFGALPYVLLLACPLLHLFLHGRHGSHASEVQPDEKPAHSSDHPGGHSHGG